MKKSGENRDMNKRYGFTLAEVLVTIMVVGVVCVMIIPQLMANTAQQEHITVYKKAVSTLSRAIEQSFALDGEDASCYTGADFIHLMTKKLNVMTHVGDTVYTADGIKFTVQDGGGNCTSDGPNAKVVCAVVDVDTNGDKGPNRTTEAVNAVYDQFTISIYPRRIEPATQAQRDVLYMTGRNRNK